MLKPNYSYSNFKKLTIEQSIIFTMRKKAKFIEIPGRRDFFIKIALATVATTLPPFIFSSCENKVAYQGSGLAPFKVWEEILQALKTSPDFLPQRVKNLTASKDPEVIYNFVKNEITLMPTSTNAISYNDLGYGYKWGIEGVLRCGMATPREKAELLSQMYNKAGISAKVVYERTDIKANEVPAFFYRPIDRIFNPDISNSQFKRWEKEMGGSSTASNQKELIKDYSVDANILGDKIKETLPNIEEFGDKYNFKWDNRATPTVEFMYNDKTRYAHLFDPNTLFGEKHNSLEGQILEAKPIKENTEKVSLKITYRNTIDHTIVRDLIQGEWNATDLIGKQIQLSFLHGLSLEEQIVTSIGNLRVFTPALALQAIDKNLEYIQDRSFLADPITIDGKIIPLSKEKTCGANGNEILSKPHPQLQKEVQKLAVIPRAMGYPMVKLSIDARDTSGSLIEKLSAKDFKITDNGQPVRALLENNVPTPKILLLYDSTGSMPNIYAGEGLIKFNNRLKEKLKEKYSDVIFDFRPVHKHKLFTGLLKASQSDFDVIVFVFDGGLDDSFDNKYASIYEEGPPTLAVKAENGYNTNSDLETYNTIAQITGGKAITDTDQETVINEISDYIDNLKLPPYVFTYASADNTKPHQVKVTLDNERLKATGNYTFPKAELEHKNGISGIYLELKIGKKAPIKRVLAGWDPVAGYYTKPDNKDVDAVQQLLLGGVMLAVEGEGPTLAVALADLLKSKLSNRKWGEAYLENDIKKATEELSKGSIHIPAALIPMLAPLQNQVTKTSITYPTGYRMCLLKTMVGLNHPATFSFDYLPTSAYQTMAKDNEERFMTTLKKTAQLAVREGTFFQQSTYTSLQGIDCIDSRTAYTEGWIKKVMDYEHIDYQYWKQYVLSSGGGYTTIFDTTASSKSFWRLMNKSGEIYGMLPDGSGGGGDTFKKQLDELNLVIDTYMLAAGLAGVASPPTAVVATYGKTLVKLYAIACESIIVMDTRGMDEEIIKAMQQLACNVLKDITLGFTGSFGTAAGVLEYLISLMGGKSPFSC